MNKEKIIGLSNRLNSIVDEANRHPNGTPGPITWDKAIYAIEALSKEANSKPVMPKVFDEWKKQYLNNRCKLLYWIAELESGGEESKQDNDLSDWLFENGIDDTFFHRYQICIEAILYGYEVEK